MAAPSLLAAGIGRMARTLSFAVMVLPAFAGVEPVRADTIQIVALGASNTAGKGVAASSAWPARLEAMLRAKSYDARVTNAGVSGDDTGRMLARVGSAVPGGTRLVILDKASSNDRLRGINTEANIAAISSNLRSRGIKTIVIAGMHGWAGRSIQPDGIHITEAGHAAVAAKLLPQVASAIGAPARRQSEQGNSP